jgi:ketosteroid isomerase-like protein
MSALRLARSRSARAPRRTALVFVAWCLVSTSLLAQQGPEGAIRKVLDKQVKAWNRGDIEGFMEGYWKSDALTFVTASGVTRGWQNVIERYRRSYPDGKAMGALSFADLEIRVLSQDSAMVLGRWQLQREADRPEGHFTLILRKFPEGWRVVHDHTTSLAPPKQPAS